MTPNLKLAFRHILLLSLTIAAAATAEAETAAPPNAVVYFINLKDGDAVKSPFKIQFGLSGMGVAPAGVEKQNTGHHHLLIDATLTPEQACRRSRVIPGSTGYAHPAPKRGTRRKRARGLKAEAGLARSLFA